MADARRVGGLEAEIAAAEEKLSQKQEAKGQLDAAVTVILMNKAIEHAQAVGGLQAEIATASAKLASLQATEARMQRAIDTATSKLSKATQPSHIQSALQATDGSVQRQMPQEIVAAITRVAPAAGDAQETQIVLQLIHECNQIAPGSFGGGDATRGRAKQRLSDLIVPMLGPDADAATFEKAVALMTACEGDCRLKGSIILEGFTSSLNGDYVVRGALVNGSPAYSRVGDAELWVSKTDSGEWAVTDTASKGTIVGDAFAEVAATPWGCESWCNRDAGNNYVSATTAKVLPLVESLEGVQGRLDELMSKRIAIAISLPDVAQIKAALTAAASVGYTAGLSEAEGLVASLEKISARSDMQVPSARNAMDAAELEALVFTDAPTGLCACLSGPTERPALTAAQVRLITSKRAPLAAPERVRVTNPAVVTAEEEGLPGTVTSLGGSGPLDGLAGRGQEWAGQRGAGSKLSAASSGLGKIAEGLPVLGGAVGAFFQGCSILGKQIEQLSDNAQDIESTLERLVPFTVVMRDIVTTVSGRYPDGNLPEGFASTFRSLTTSLDTLAGVIRDYASSSAMEQASNANEFNRELARVLSTIDSHKGTLHASLSADTGSQVNQVHELVRKKNTREKVTPRHAANRLPVIHQNSDSYRVCSMLLRIGS